MFPHWLDVDNDGCKARDQVLRRDSITPAQVDIGCTVIAGDWRSPYDGLSWESPSDLEIDHVVALKEAWDSGAWAWDAERRTAYANDTTDPRTLKAVTSSVNQAKSADDPSNWLPPLHSDWCRYLEDWIAIKARWGLSMDQSEAGRIRNVLASDCPNATIAPWSPAPTLSQASPATPEPTTLATSVPTDGGGGSGSHPYYENCAAARAAGAAPLSTDDPGYRSGLDGDSDGVGCE